MATLLSTQRFKLFDLTLSHTSFTSSCGVCSKTFKRNEHLSRHSIIHSGLKAQVCTECGKGFYRSDHLRKHLMGHRFQRQRTPKTKQPQNVHPLPQSQNMPNVQQQGDSLNHTSSGSVSGPMLFMEATKYN